MTETPPKISPALHAYLTDWQRQTIATAEITE